MRHLINILDLSVAEIESLIEVAENIIDCPDVYGNKCKNKILATLFFEPSTRTRLSFESAMLSLGGQVIGFSGSDMSSISKGESLKDTIKIIAGYADVIAMRHFVEGSAYIAKQDDDVPIINAGDGAHFHPTQTLTDLLTIHREKGTFENLTIGICGDLKYGRTVHSLICAMSRYSGTKFVLVSPPNLNLPDFIQKQYIDAQHIEVKYASSVEEALPYVDIMYMTRIQRERFENVAECENLEENYKLTADKMKLAKDDMCVLHPLPRVDEISVDVDDDKRALYFRQAHDGKYIRMALIMAMLGMIEGFDMQGDEEIEKDVIYGKKCTNLKCVSNVETNIKHTAQLSEDGRYRCIYCDTEINKV